MQTEQRAVLRTRMGRRRARARCLTTTVCGGGRCRPPPPPASRRRRSHFVRVCLVAFHHCDYPCSSCGTSVPAAATDVLTKCKADLEAAASNADVQKSAEMLRAVIVLSRGLAAALCPRTATNGVCYLALPDHKDMVG